jgi:hypothetical protein
MTTVGAYVKNWNQQAPFVASCIKRGGLPSDARYQPFEFDGVWATPSDNSVAEPQAAPLTVLHPVPRGELAVAFVAPSLTLFENSWCAALLRQLNRSVANDGTICLPWRKGLDNPAKGWSQAWLQEQFGTPLRTFRSPDAPMLDLPWRGRPTWFGCFAGADEMQQRNSVLDWWFRDHAATRDEHVAMLLDKATPFNQDLPARCDEFLLSKVNVPAAITTADDTKPYSLPPTLDSEALSSLQSHHHTMSYALTGANYKSAVMGHIIEQHFPDGRPLRIVDHGGGIGQFVIELLLGNQRVEKAVNCDVSAEHLMLSARIFEFFRKQLRGRYFMQLQPSEEFDYDESYDVVSFMGSMLYLPRAGLDGTLDRLWNALNAGGLMVIHENIKHESFERDYDIMFTADELDKRLEQFGKIIYYASTSRKRFAPEQVGNKCVFRVIQKSL